MIPNWKGLAKKLKANLKREAEDAGPARECEWHNGNEMPTKEGQYLCVVVSVDQNMIKKQFEVIECERGYFDPSMDWGYDYHKMILAWTELPAMPEIKSIAL